MSQNEFLIMGLRRQREILDDLIHTLERKKELGSRDGKIYDARTKEVEKNLRRLRRTVAEEVFHMSRFKLKSNEAQNKEE